MPGLSRTQLKRHFGGHTFYEDSSYGAYGAGNRAQGKKDAKERADSLRKRGRLARITLERRDYGSYWVVWQSTGR